MIQTGRSARASTPWGGARARIADQLKAIRRKAGMIALNVALFLLVTAAAVAS
jgi:hypothetical protein